MTARNPRPRLTRLERRIVETFLDGDSIEKILFVYGGCEGVNVHIVDRALRKALKGAR